MIRTPFVMLFLLLIPVFCFAAACPELSADSARHRLEGLGEEIRTHNRLYYQELRPVITDAEYDRLLAELVRLEACFPSLAASDSPTRTVGSGLAPRAPKVVHARPMLSLESSADAVTVEALLRRVEKAAGDIRLLVQPKVDGLPIELTYQGGQLVSAATRGDGFVGEDVTARVRQIQGIPMALVGAVPTRIAVRGEVYVDLQVLAAKGSAAAAGKYATPRHLAAATLRAGDPDPQALAALRLLPYEMVSAEPAISGIDSDRAALQLLAAWGFPVPPEHMHPAESLDEVRAIYREYLGSRDRQPFAMDGIVVKVDDLSLRQRLGEGHKAPLWAAAWKFPPATARTEVLAIHWRVGRTGRRTPVAELAPVDLGGVRVSRVSLHNAAEVARLDLKVGDHIIVALAGDVILQVVEVVGKEPRAATVTVLPEPAADACLEDSPGCREQFLARAVHFASRAGLNIPGLGRGRMQMLVEAGLMNDLPALFRLQEEDIAAVPGFGNRAARQLTAAIRVAGRPPLPRLLTALGIPGVGPAAARRLAAQFATLDRQLAADEAELTAIAGVSQAAAKYIRSFFASPGGRKLLEEFHGLSLLTDARVPATAPAPEGGSGNIR